MIATLSLMPVAMLLSFSGDTLQAAPGTGAAFQK